VSLILISISWCDVYLTTRCREATSGAVSSLSPSLSSLFLFFFLSLTLSLFSSWNSSWDVLFRDTAGFCQGRNELLPFLVVRLECGGAQVAATAICIQSTLIRLDRRGGTRRHPLTLISPCPSAITFYEFCDMDYLDFIDLMPIVLMIDNDYLYTLYIVCFSLFFLCIIYSYIVNDEHYCKF